MRLLPYMLRRFSAFTISKSYCDEKNTTPSLYKTSYVKRQTYFDIDRHQIPQRLDPIITSNFPSEKSKHITYIKFPMGIIQKDRDFFPVVVEEASIVAGATGMLKLLDDSFQFETTSDGLKVTAFIPFEKLNKAHLSGQELAKGIVEIYKFAMRDPLRAITNNKGIINAVFPFIFAFYPTQAIQLTAQLMASCEHSGKEFKTNASQYGPLIHWHLDQKKQQLTVEFNMPNLKPIQSNVVDNAHNSLSRLIFQKYHSLNETTFQQSIAKLAIAQNLAALRSIFDRGNRAHHMDHHNKATREPSPIHQPITIDQTPHSVLDSLIECFVAPFPVPLKTYSISNHIIAAVDLFRINNKAIELMDKSIINIKTNPPTITNQVVFRKRTGNLTPKAFMDYVFDPHFLASLNQKVMAFDQLQKDDTLNRLKRRLKRPIVLPDKTTMQQIGHSVVRLNTEIYTGETQGANRANAYAEAVRWVMNQEKDQTGWEAMGGILSNHHSRRGPTIEIRIPKSRFESLNIDYRDLIRGSESVEKNPILAKQLNIAALEGMFMVDFVTGQDTRGNIASFLFAALEHPIYGHQDDYEFLYEPSTATVHPFIIIKEEKNDIILTSTSMASARTAVGRVVNSLEGVQIARDLMNIPIPCSSLGKVEKLDEKASLMAALKALDFYLDLIPPKT